MPHLVTNGTIELALMGFYCSLLYCEEYFRDYLRGTNSLHLITSWGVTFSSLTFSQISTTSVLAYVVSEI